MASPLSYHWSQRLSRITHVFKQPPCLSRMVLCQFLLCVFLSFSSCVCVPVLSSFHSAPVLVQTQSTTCTHSLSLGTHAHANALPFTRHLCSCKHCLQCAHTHPFTQHSCLCRCSPFHLAFTFMQTLSTVCTHTHFHSALTLMLSLGIRALANAVYSVHTLFL